MRSHLNRSMYICRHYRTLDVTQTNIAFVICYCYNKRLKSKSTPHTQYPINRGEQTTDLAVCNLLQAETHSKRDNNNSRASPVRMSLERLSTTISDFNFLYDFGIFYACIERNCSQFSSVSLLHRYQRQDSRESSQLYRMEQMESVFKRTSTSTHSYDGESLSSDGSESLCKIVAREQEHSSQDPP